MNLPADVVFCSVSLLSRPRILLMEKSVIGREDTGTGTGTDDTWIGGLVKGFRDFLECAGFSRETAEVKTRLSIKAELTEMLDMLQ